MCAQLAMKTQLDVNHPNHLPVDVKAESLLTGTSFKQLKSDKVHNSDLIELEI